MGRFRAMKPPTKVRGMEMRNHTATMLAYMPRGTAPEVPECV
jgi:hypothetical protein